MTDEREERIKKRAREIWEREGSQEGREHDHWRQAEEEIAVEGNGESEPPADPDAKKT